MTPATLDKVVTVPNLGLEEGFVPPNPVDATTYSLASHASVHYAWTALNGASVPAGLVLHGAMEHTDPFERVPLPFSEANHSQVRLCTFVRPSIDHLLVLPVNAMESNVLLRIRQCVSDAVDEVFMDGMNSVFSRQVTLLVTQHGDVAVSVLDHLLGTDEISAEVSGEILRTLGALTDNNSYFSRLRLLVKQLKSHDPRIRDAASLGLASLDEPMSLPNLLEAYKVEKSELVQRNIGLVIEQLEQT